jgi:hypothetical protein
MKYSGAIALFSGLIALIIWWQWPDWGRPEYWFPRQPRIVTYAVCKRGQLTTMKPDDGGRLTPVAMNPVVARVIFEKPHDPLEPYNEAQWAQRLEAIPRKVDRFFTLVDQGHIVRIPEAKLVRYVGPSSFANWIVEVEVFRRGDKPLRGFVFWTSLDCFKLPGEG